MATPGAPATVTRHAPTGMVCSVDHLASSAGVDVLRRGGSAVDAAVAASAVLAVTCPHLCGMGGDLFAIVHGPGLPSPVALNASGRAGSGADAERLRAEGHTAMPFHGDVRAAPVPGCVDGWLALHARFGRLPLTEVLAAAAGYATTGFPTSPLLAVAQLMLADVAGADRRGTDDLFASRRLRAGDLVRRPGVARALHAIASTGRAGFYEGEFGEGLLALGSGEYRSADLRRPLADWVEPLRVDAWGHGLWTIPPNSQGYLTLLGAAVADGLALPDDPDDPAWAHLLVESARAAGHDRPSVLHEGADVAPLLEPAAVDRRRALVDPDCRNAALPTGTAEGGTMHLCAADGDGTAVSLIQSNASGFGCLVFEPSTGIGLHNRGIGFNLDPGHPACYGPGRRPPHTLSPAMVTRPDGSVRAAVGTMGGDSQPQILLQVLCRFLRHGASPGEAITAPRWTLVGTTGFDTWTAPGGAVVQLEHHAPAAWRAGLEARGHRVTVADPRGGHGFGHAHLLEATSTGWAGAADPRAEVGAAAGC
jgi:gamma-glutamyltranspeptidase / glutathione hydrolase